MPDEFPDYPEFQLRLPYGGPTAHGRLLPEMGTNGSQKFKILAGSPVRPEVVPSFPKQMTSSNRLRESLIAEGAIRRSTSRPEYLETTRDIVCNSPSAAADVLLGRAGNGWKEWITEDGRPLGEFVEAVWPGPNRTWLVRGANVAVYDLVQRLWLPKGVVSLPATNLRPGVRQGASKEQLRTFVDEDYGPDASYGQKRQLVEELHAFLSRMKPGDTVCTVSGGDLYVGKVAGSVRQDASDAGRHNLIRPAEWQDTAYPAAGLPEELRQRLSIQGDLVDPHGAHRAIGDEDGIAQGTDGMDYSLPRDSGRRRTSRRRRWPSGWSTVRCASWLTWPGWRSTGTCRTSWSSTR